VNLPPGSLRTLIGCIVGNKVQEQLALESLNLEKGAEIIFPVFTFPVIPMAAKMLGYKPVFCDVDPRTYNSGPEHIEPKITDKTGAILATHLFGQPCPIRPIAGLARERNIRLLEDCAHACGVRIDGQQAGTFGDIGIFSFAEGKNMPCFGGGAIATSDEEIAERAAKILSESPIADKDAIIKKALSIWVMWLLTRPFIFGITAYQALRLKLLMGQPLMDSAVGDDLLEEFKNSSPRVSRMSNLQAATGLLQLKHIDAFNEGARQNARILTENLGEVAGITAPDAVEGDHIYVYYPLTVDPARRDDLRHYLLKEGFDTKTTDMSDCSALGPFRDLDETGNQPTTTKEASILEICVYPVVPQEKMRQLAVDIRTWANKANI
jgi:dTDP-4-amino-4,6-dideoxygalactose transaminase